MVCQRCGPRGTKDGEGCVPRCSNLRQAVKWRVSPSGRQEHAIALELARFFQAHQGLSKTLKFLGLGLVVRENGAGNRPVDPCLHGKTCFSRRTRAPRRDA